MWRVIRLLVMQYGWNFMSVLGDVHSISRLLKLFCDNSAVVSFSRNTRSTSHSKHIDMKFYFVKKKVAKSLILVEHMPITNMLARLTYLCVSRPRHPHGVVRSLDSLF